MVPRSDAVPHRLAAHWDRDPGTPFSFTYPPFAAWLFSAGAGAPVSVMRIALTAGSVVALAVLCVQALIAVGVRPRPVTVFAVSALALQTWPVAYTLHLGEVRTRGPAPLPEGADPFNQLEHERGQRGPRRADVQQLAADHVDIGAVGGPQLVGHHGRTADPRIRQVLDEQQGLMAADARRGMTWQASRFTPFEGVSISGAPCGRGDLNPHGVATNRT
jgi:glycosyl transferase family 87